ncbi:hypothetical protein AB0399_40425 [Streptomyces sp. NPDC088194]|uniref:hypothetical protein n=1 Tax=Streptomyces sp. NPDC088194 TaxID=3154931 RepID=UPI00344B17AB
MNSSVSAADSSRWSPPARRSDRALTFSGSVAASAAEGKSAAGTDLRLAVHRPAVHRPAARQSRPAVHRPAARQSRPADSPSTDPPPARADPPARPA